MILSNPFKPDLRVYREAKSLVKAGYQVTVIAWDRERQYDSNTSIDGITVVRIKTSGRYSAGIMNIFNILVFWYEAARLIRRHNFDVIHCHDLDTLIVGVWIKFVFRRKLIYDAHEKFSMMVLMSSSRSISRLVEIYERILLWMVDQIIVASSKFGRELERTVSRPVAVIGNWQENPVLDMKRVGEIRKNLAGDAYELFIIYIGVLDRSRQILPMIEAVKTYPQIKFAIFGDGIQRSRILDSITATKNIEYGGVIPLAMVPYYTAAADVVFYMLNEKQPISAYQAPNSLGFALVTGRALLASNSGELGIAINRYKCGVMPDDATAKSIKSALNILLDHDKLIEFQSNARMAGNELNWEAMQGVLLGLYNKVISL